MVFQCWFLPTFSDVICRWSTFLCGLTLSCDSPVIPIDSILWCVSPYPSVVRSLVLPGATAAILRVLQCLGLLGGRGLGKWAEAYRGTGGHGFGCFRNCTLIWGPHGFSEIKWQKHIERQVSSKSSRLKSSHHLSSLSMFHHGISMPCWGLRCNLCFPTLPADRAAAPQCANRVADGDRGIW